MILTLLSSILLFGTFMLYLIGIVNVEISLKIVCLSIFGIICFIIISAQLYRKEIKRMYKDACRTSCEDSCPVCLRTDDEIFKTCSECGYKPSK